MKAIPDNRGERHGQSKLTEWDILAIRLDDRQQKVISYYFNICQSRVSEIKNKKAEAFMRKPIFFIGLHMVSHANEFKHTMISVNVLKRRKSDFYPQSWLMDSGAFTELYRLGCYQSSPQEYVEQVERWSKCGHFLGAVSQDYMCEPFILQKTGFTVRIHQMLTIQRYDIIRSLTDKYIMPVLQGYDIIEYLDHIRQYGDRLKEGMWVGVGSVCKRNSNPAQIENVLTAIKMVRPDLKLHGFGLKKTALKNDVISSLLYSCDSMAWSYRSRMMGNGNDINYAHKYNKEINNMPIQGSFDGEYYRSINLQEWTR